MDILRQNKTWEDTGDWIHQAPEIPESEIKETVEADIVVVGGGLAGVAAIREAVEQGASVVLFEKCKIPQARSGDFAVMDSKVADLWGRRKVDKTAIVADLMKDMGYRVDQRILRAWAEHAGEAFDWYLEPYPDIPVLKDTREVPPAGARCWIHPRRLPKPESFDNSQEQFKCYQVTAWVRPTHIPVFRANYKKAEDSGLLRSYMSTPARKLVQDDTGRVIGAIAQKEDGSYVRAMAKRGVILATGDYMSDDEMMYHFCPGAKPLPRMWTSYDARKQPSNTGDGHRMAVWAGAKMQDSPHAPMAHHMGGALGASGFLLLNLQGERFVNEDVPGQQINNQLLTQPGRMAWQFADSNWPVQIPYVTPNHGSVCYLLSEEDKKAGVLGTIDCFTSQEILDKAVEDGSMLKADTLEELVEKTGLPKETALASIRRYNEFCANKRDSDFGKQEKRLFPVEQGPFYATRFVPATMIVCMGGIDSDEYCRAYRADGSVIPGLYVTGNVQGNRFSGEYPLTVPGISHSMALTLGRIAGASAAAMR